MNLEKLENKCQFCKNYNHFYRKRKGNCLLDENNCALQIWTVGYAKDQNLAIAWEPHPDIAEAVQPETTERTAKAKYPIQMDGTYNKHVTYCSDCGTTVRNQLYCHHCGCKLIWIE